MVQRGSGLGLVNEPRLVLLVFQLRDCQKLEGHRTVEFEIFALQTSRCSSNSRARKVISTALHLHDSSSMTVAPSRRDSAQSVTNHPIPKTRAISHVRTKKTYAPFFQTLTVTYTFEADQRQARRLLS